jgi:hypothetical protein
VFVLLVVGTWAISVENLFIGLTGRSWVGVAFSVALGVVPLGFMLLAVWISAYPEYRAMLRQSVPYVVWTLVAAKFGLAAWTLPVLRRRRLLGRIEITRFLSAWLIAVVVLCGIGCWLIPHSLAPWHQVVPCAVLLVPLVRMALGPLALAWNRHR